MDHLAQDSDFDRRIAFISVDNAVEVTLRTYLGLPRRARGSEGPSRRELESASSSFPDLLDLAEQYAADHLEGIELADIEWYHRTRNALYHQGNGITVARSHVDGYLQIARVLGSRLLGVEVSEISSASPSTAAGRVVEAWSRMEDELRELIDVVVSDPSYRFRDALVDLLELGLITDRDDDELNSLLSFRSQAVHQPDALSDDKVSIAVRRLRHFTMKFEKIRTARLQDEDAGEAGAG